MRIARTLAATLAICALAAPVASAQQSQKQDLRSPDARDAAAATRSQQQDLRTPDTRDAALRLHRSGLVVGTLGPTEFKPEPAAPAVETTRDGTDWATIGLGIAGGLFAVVGVALIATRRRMPPLRPSA